MAAPPPRAGAATTGATLIDPESVWFAYDTKLGRDVTVEPHVVFGPGVDVADGATIHAFSHIEGAIIGAKASIGPFARIRPGTRLGRRTKVGNFVELKKAEIGEGAKVNHLSYVGDASVGAEANIGAGTITCNYDGFGKYRTDDRGGRIHRIQHRAGRARDSRRRCDRRRRFGDHADVEADSLALERSEQKGIAGWARRFRERMTRKAAEYRPSLPPPQQHRTAPLFELEKSDELGKIGRLVVVHVHMPAVGCRELAVRQLFSHRGHVGGIHRVIFSRDHQRRH